MSLKSKIEAVIYASEEPVTLQQLVTLLSEEVQTELDALAARQTELPLAAEDPEGGEPGTAPQQTAEAVGVTNENAAERSSGEIPPEAGSAAVHDTVRADGTAQAASTEGEEGPGEVAESASEPSTGSEDPLQELAEEGPDERSPEAEKRFARERERAVREYLRTVVESLIRDYAESDRGLEIREVAGGFRFGTKPEYHDAVRGFVKSLKPALKLSLQALETLAVVAYKQPVTAAEISEIRGVDSAGVLGGLLTRKLIQTAGRKQVIGRPMLYKTTKEFLVRFGLKDIQELPSMEEFERMAGELAEQEDLPMEETESIIERANARGDAEHIRETTSVGADASPAAEAGSGSTHADEDTRDSSPEPEQTGAGEGDSSARSEAEPAAPQQTAEQEQK